MTSSVVAGDSVRFPSTTGFHRTINELERRKNNELTVVGGRVRYQSRYGLIGATAYKSSFDKFITRGTARNQLFDFEGKDHSVAGVDYRGVIGNVLIFGEVARSENDAYAGIVGLESNISALTRVSMVYRNFDKAFQSFFGETFGEVSGRPRNEEGFYIGLRHDISPSVRVSTYFDQYTFEAPRVGTSQTTRGYDVLGLVEVFVNRDFQFYVLARTETSDDEILVNDEFGREFRVLADETRSSVRVQADYQVNPKIRLRTRWEWVRFSGAASDAEFGYLIFQDIRYTPNRKWKIDGRITVFDTDSFNSRVFQFENDLLYVLSNVALSDKGERMYVVVSYKPKPYIEVGGKYSISIFEDRFTVGSGLNESFGDTRSQLGLQVRLFF